MSFVSTARVPTLEPAGTAVTGPPRRSIVSRIVTRVGGGLMYTVVVLIALIWLLPTTGLLVASLRPASASAATGWWHVFTKPSELTLANYTNLLHNRDMVGGLWNSVLITVPSTILVVAIGALAAYALAWQDFRGRDTLFAVVVALIVVPIQMAIIPDAKLFGALGIFGTLAGVIVFHVAFGLPFAIFLLRNFFLGIPRDLLEAARMDGGTEFMIFTRVVLPIGWPAIASLTIFQFLFVWNDLLVAKVFAGASSKPITYVLQEQMGTFSSNVDVIAPGAFLSMLLPLIVFFAFQRYFVQGVLAGSVK
ncbi:carbohydrate ABC transporter permease [Dactylosporangium sp. CA-139066]|uniref:carbohydrate ABC transporter permease n=1 Tax=Dactylosporangium sp. CA-139066 TaxID=3239930 RepID=UPI003D92484C